MTIARRLPAALCLLLLPWGASAWAAAPDGERRGDAASRALAHARAVLAGDARGGVRGDATQALLRLRHSMAALPDSDAEAAARVLARPAQPHVLCGAHTCVHWKDPGLLGGGDAPPSADKDEDGVPDWVETTKRVMERAWDREIGGLGYRKPLPDGTPTTLPAGDVDKLDAYLQNVGGQGIYGYAATESGGTTSPAYLVLDNDYKEFGAPPIKSLKATAAHELFHAVQFAYDTTDAGWLMESTATWMEEQVFDGVNDNRNYLPYSSLRTPSQSLTTRNGGTEYGNWVFYQFVSEHQGKRVIRNLWWRASRSGVEGRTAIAGALRQAGTGLTTTFGKFSAASNAPRRSYEEGRAFPRAEIERSWRFGGGTTRTGVQQVVLDHLTAANFAFKPGDLNGPWRLRVAVDAPAAFHVAHVIVFLRDGGSERLRIGLDGSGQGSRVVAFSHRKVRKVVLDVASASTTDNRTTRFKATALH